MASCLVHSTLDQVVWVQTLVGECVPLQGILLDHNASPHPGVQMGTSELIARNNPVMDYHPIQGGVVILPIK